MDASVNSGVHSLVQKSGLATSQAHVGGGSLESLSLAILCLLGLGCVRVGGVLNTLDDIRHGAGAVGAEDLDGLDVSLLGHTVLLASDSSRAVGSVAVAILIGIALRDSLAPLGAALEVDVVNVRAGVDDVHVNALTTIGGVQVLVEGTEGEAVTVGDTSQTPWGVLLGLARVRAEGADLLVLLDKLNLEGVVSTLFLISMIRVIVTQPWWLHDVI